MVSDMITCDIFCTVIDNYGDIGICWRLARQLAHEYDWQVRLWVDNLATFAQLCPTLDPQAPRQLIQKVAIEPWRADFNAHSIEQAADVVLEAFGCEIPTAYLERMRERAVNQKAPVWVNVEYLSAEAWVADFHLLPSPHPRYSLTKTCFFPGLKPGTGGVLKERALCQTREDFMRDTNVQANFWHSLNVPPPAETTTTVSLFAYENSSLPRLLNSWSENLTPITCIVPEGRLSGAVADFFKKPAFGAGTVAKHKNLTVYSIPFVEQNQYDRLLWACDINFVRGEDSFIRAQWAQRPLVWHIYPQTENAHVAKLDAALNLYTAGLSADASSAFVRFWHAWNGVNGALLDWQDFWQHQEIFANHAQHWAQKLTAVGDLSSHLVKFCETQLQYAAKKAHAEHT